MNEEEMRELAKQYVTAVSENDGEHAERYLMMFGREVERHVRHKAVSLAYGLAETINKLKD
jgi:hypothetical protein